MHDIQERVAIVETRFEEHRLAVDKLEARIDRRFDQAEQRIENRFAAMDRRFDNLEGRLGRQGYLLTVMLIAIIGGMGGIIAAILQR